MFLQRFLESFTEHLPENPHLSQIFCSSAKLWHVSDKFEDFCELFFPRYKWQSILIFLSFNNTQLKWIMTMFGALIEMKRSVENFNALHYYPSFDCQSIFAFFATETRRRRQDKLLTFVEHSNGGYFYQLIFNKHRWWVLVGLVSEQGLFWFYCFLQTFK